MKTLSLRLIEGSIDQVAGTVQARCPARHGMQPWPALHRRKSCVPCGTHTTVRRVCMDFGGGQGTGLMPCIVAHLQVSWVQPRVLTLDQVGGLKTRLDAWISKVGSAALTLEEQQLGVLA